MAMVYTLVEIAREWLIENNIAAGVSLRCSTYAPLVWKTADPAGVLRATSCCRMAPCTERCSGACR